MFAHNTILSTSFRLAWLPETIMKIDVAAGQLFSDSIPFPFYMAKLGMQTIR